MTNNTNQTFLFLPNGKPLSTINNEARRESKNNKTENLSFFKNKISKALFNISYNKLVNGMEENSPKIIDNILYVPVTIDLRHYDQVGEFNYYVAVSDQLVALNIDSNFLLNIKTPFIEKLNFSDFEKIDNGWHVKLPESSFLEIKIADEGLVVDYYIDNGEECVDTRYIGFEEIFDDFGNFDYINNKALNDNQTAFDMRHDEDSRTVLFSLGGACFNIFSSCIIEKENCTFTLEQIVNEIKESKGDVSEFFNWLKGQYVEKYNDWIIDNGAYFGLESESGYILSDVFDSIECSFSERSMIAAQTFIID